jgi:hypothetical protein
MVGWSASSGAAAAALLAASELEGRRGGAAAGKIAVEAEERILGERGALGWTRWRSCCGAGVAAAA